jgi:NhaA family Na+:H+ antiporter
MGLVLAFAVRRERIHAIEAKLNALVSYVALPLFGLYASSVVLPEASILNSAVFWGVVVRPVWKFLGVFLGGWIGMHFASEKMKLRTVDLAKVAVLGGIGFTVSLLVANIAFGAGRSAADQAGAVVGTFIASAISMVAGALVLSSGHRSESTHGS